MGLIYKLTQRMTGTKKNTSNMPSKEIPLIKKLDEIEIIHGGKSKREESQDLDRS
jgi:hypothetical protein